MEEKLIFNWDESEIVESEVEYYLKDEPSMIVEKGINVSEDVNKILDKYYDENKTFENILKEKDLYDDVKEKIKNHLFESYSFWEFRFEGMINSANYSLQQEIGESDTTWYGEASNVGWRNVSGEGKIDGDIKDIIDSITPNSGDFTAKIYLMNNEFLKCKVWHHDSPVNPELYKLFPYEYFRKRIEKEINKLNDFGVLRELFEKLPFNIHSKIPLHGNDRFQRRRDYLHDIKLERRCLK